MLSSLSTSEDFTYTQALSGCQFSTSGSTYTADGCSFNDHIVNPGFDPVYFTILGKWSGRGSFDQRNHRVEWAKDWIEGGNGLGIDPSLVGYEGECESDPSGYGVQVCTNNQSVADKLKNYGDGISKTSLDGWEFGYDVRMPVSAVKRLAENGTCSGSVTYLRDNTDDTRTEATHQQTGNLVILDRRVACKIGTIDRSPEDNVDYFRIVSADLTYTVDTSVFAATSEETSSNSSDDGDSGTGGGSGDGGTSTIDDGDDDSGTTGSGTGTVDGGDASVGETIDTTIIAFIQSAVDAVRSIVGV